jgi:hypothetical protein
MSTRSNKRYLKTNNNNPSREISKTLPNSIVILYLFTLGVAVYGIYMNITINSFWYFLIVAIIALFGISTSIVKIIEKLIK